MGEGSKLSTPAGLSARARRLWKAVTAAFELSAAEEHLLRLALIALDRADAAAAVLAADGFVVLDRYGSPKAHPAVDVEHRARGFYAAAVRQLGIAFEEPAVEESSRTRQARRAANARWGRVARLDEARTARGGS